MSWQPIQRPGHFGEKREELFREYDKRYGKDNWKIKWSWGLENYISFLGACHIYEGSYLADSFKREEVWLELIREASDVYDHESSNVEAGFNYSVQNGNATHIQDIAIRNVVRRRGWKFKGDKLVQVRSHKEKWGKLLSPGKVPFHDPPAIETPHLDGWWERDSVEDFYQSNKWLLVREVKLL